MRIDIITVSPELIKSPFEHSIIKRAIEKQLVDIHFHNLRDYAVNRYGKIDDYQFGGGAGMVLMIEPIDKCLTGLFAARKYDEVIYMTPDAQRLDQQCANQLSIAENLIILTGHYKGVDQRIRDAYITKEISIGDYVLSGGELAAAVLCDAVIRLIPGVLGDETSALTDSFQDNLLAGGNPGAAFTGKEPGYGKGGCQHAQHVPQIPGRGHVDDFPDPVTEMFQVVDAKGQADAPGAAEQIGGDRKRRILHLFKKQGLSALRAFGFRIGQSADLQNSGYGVRNDFQLAVIFQGLDKLAKIVVFHEYECLSFLWG